MADRGRGGNQPPRNPAAVSNPGSGARTDGGAGSKSQPLRVASGGAYGERQAALDQQRGAPLAAEGEAPQGQAGGSVPTGGAGPGPGGPVSGGGAFGPTGFPQQSNTLGAQADPILNNPDTVMRILYSVLPHPNIGMLFNSRSDYR